MIIVVEAAFGASTRQLSKNLAFELGLKYVSKEDLVKGIENSDEKIVFEKLKQEIQSKTRTGNIITDCEGAAWHLQADLKVFIQSLKKSRASEIAKNEKISLNEAMEQVENSEKEKAKKMLDNYGIDVFDLSVFDLVLNGSKLDEAGITAMIKKFIEKMK